MGIGITSCDADTDIEAVTMREPNGVGTSTDDGKEEGVSFDTEREDWVRVDMWRSALRDGCG